MDVIWHHDEGVELILAFAAVVLEGVEEEFSSGGALEDASAIRGGGSDEVGSCGVEAFGGERHAVPSVPQRLKPLNSTDGLRHG